ncbi:hypothetical protein D3870_17685 [Noviherbaspirillum cavernae]|uniref:Uncharacterized protein n=1 Tax=Noviherbaspirillum cavernae TaxID=2320862 RepID=A0A418X5C8_9BURK|nr:hypothetical protein [Noviherbaspirillum cavernae]RJG07581.1 hypothetical protein D3870_17685 [Noviherbaspirillum cavernae]
MHDGLVLALYVQMTCEYLGKKRLFPSFLKQALCQRRHLMFQPERIDVMPEAGIPMSDFQIGDGSAPRKSGGADRAFLHGAISQKCL